MNYVFQDGQLETKAARLRETLADLAESLDPFPAFLGMISIQAVELELPSGDATPGLNQDLGCVVVAPGGRICSLDLGLIPEAPGVTDSGQVAELTELDLPTQEYIVYATEAIRVLNVEKQRRADS